MFWQFEFFHFGGGFKMIKIGPNILFLQLTLCVSFVLWYCASNFEPVINQWKVASLLRCFISSSVYRDAVFATHKKFTQDWQQKIINCDKMSSKESVYLYDET